MAKIPPHIIDEIMQTARIEEVIGEFVNLKRAGSNLKGLSPFVDEKSPSFMVSPAKQIFKCFSSGKGGSVVTFLMEKEHYSYPEALKWLASRYNILIPEEREQTPEEQAAISERESLYIINDFARKYFMETMHEHQEGQAIGLSYFEERGFRMDIIKKFELGYCLNSGTAFTQEATQKGYNLEYLKNVGLVKSKDDRNFDFFRGRVMFPIHSVSGRVLGFGGRTLITDNKKVAKYFNSPESIIYNKSEILYGLFFAKGDIIKYDNCFLCEGYTDVISMHQAGVCNSVSSSGTSLTKEQIRLIKRYTNNITILFDGDAAGIKASFRGIDLILEEGLNVKVVLFPDGDDPDSYSKKVSTTELMDFIKSHTQDFVRFKTSMLLAEDGNDPLKRAALIRNIVQSISLIPDSITRMVYAKEIAKDFEIEESLIIEELNKSKRVQISNELKEPAIAENPSLTDSEPQAQPQFQTASQREDLYTREEYELIRVLVKYGAYAVNVDHISESGEIQKVTVSAAEWIVHELEKDELEPRYPLFKQIYNETREALKTGTLFYTSAWLKHTNMEVVKFVSEIESEEHTLSPRWFSVHRISVFTEIDKLYKLVEEAINGLKLRTILWYIDDIHKELKTIEDSDVKTQDGLMMELVYREKVKLVIADKLGRSIL